MYSQVLQQREARDVGERIMGGVMQRFAARMLQQLLQTSGNFPASTYRGKKLG